MVWLQEAPQIMARHATSRPIKGCVQAGSTRVRASKGSARRAHSKEQPEPPPPGLPQISAAERAANRQLVRAAIALDELYELIGNYAPMQPSESRRKNAESDLRLAKQV
jgi:hypothetical protein